MAPPTYIVLHKNEWERIKRQAGPPPKEPEHLKKEYLQELTEKSQAWMKTWPDTVAGHIAELEKEKKDTHKANVAFIKAYGKQRKQEDGSAPIKKAKQLIFDKTCYGRKLLSALLESKAIEVRDAQIKFQKEIQQKQAEIEKKQEEATQQVLGINDFHTKDLEKETAQICRFKECVKYNKNTAALKKEKLLQNKLKEKEEAIEVTKLLKDALQVEKKQKEAMKNCVPMEIKKFESMKKEIADIKKQENALDDELIQIHKKGQDRIKCKSGAILKEVHQGRPDTKWSKDLYEQVEQLQHEKMKRYDEFVEKGIKALNEREAGIETQNNLRDKQKRSTRSLVSQENNKIVEVKQALKYANKCSCDRQTLGMKTKKTEKLSKEKFKPKADADPKSTETNTADTELERTEKARCAEKPEKNLFLEPRNQLLEDLRKRAKEPSGWNGMRGEHAYFAHQANNVLKEIKHKHFARQVVDEYRKSNVLDDTTLPVPNY